MALILKLKKIAVYLARKIRVHAVMTLKCTLNNSSTHHRNSLILRRP